jgi:vancomycin resistance protein VanW
MKRLLPQPIRVELRRAVRWLCDLRYRPQLARRKAPDAQRYPRLLVAHESKLLRDVGSQWMPLQRNKVHNLALACARLNGLLIAPGEVFSFCTLVGRTGRRRGYLDGLEMHHGELLGAPGGGLCQLSNLLYWMALHLDVEIIEHHRHGFDLFPDDGRVVPFGIGATVFYNYLDFRFRNSLDQPLLLTVGVEPPMLRGGFYSDREKAFDVSIVETAHRFFRGNDGAIWRENRVAKQISYRDGRPCVTAEIAHNLARVRYHVPDHLIEG